MKKITMSKTALVVTAIVLIAGAAGIYAWASSDGYGSSSNNTNNTAYSANTNTDQYANRTGKFQDVEDKTGSGGVTVTKNDEGAHVVRLEEDFTVQKGPALYVSFANNGEVAKDTLFAELKELEGAQEYVVPENINVEDYDQVMIYCEEFSVAFAVANLN